MIEHGCGWVQPGRNELSRDALIAMLWLLTTVTAFESSTVSLAMFIFSVWF